jgi:hypothetical protein
MIAAGPPTLGWRPPKSLPVNAEREQTVLEYLEPVPTPSGVSSRELVRRAIEYAAPPRLPYSFFRPLRSDFCELVFVEEAILGRPGRERGELYRDEWGIVRKVSGGRWDQVVEHPLSDLTRLERARFPAAEVAERTARLAPWVERARKAGKYCLGFDPVLMFERACDLVGFEELLVAPYTQPQQLEALLDQLADLSVSAIEQWHQIGGVDGFMTWEDWGHQAGLPLKLETFRRFYKPRYARIVEAAHRRGMHFIWHNCGQIREMIPEMIELGVDVVQMDQPRLVGHRDLAEAFGGEICFWNAVDTQWSLREELSDDELRAEVSEMVEAFERLPGGFMARHYPHGDEIGLSDARQRVICDAFLASGCGQSECA